MKKANPTFETFKMLNADLSQENKLFHERVSVQGKLFEVNKRTET